MDAVAAFLVLGLLPGIITLLKGQYALFLAGLIVPTIVWYIAAFRLAKPESPWARWWYSSDKQRRAERRYAA